MNAKRFFSSKSIAYCYIDYSIDNLHYVLVINYENKMLFLFVDNCASRCHTPTRQFCRQEFKESWQFISTSLITCILKYILFIIFVMDDKASQTSKCNANNGSVSR